MEHRYWRIYITANNGATTCTIPEIELRAGPGTADLTGSGTASASTSAGAGFEASRAFDNTAGTRWSSSATSPPQWIKYDFGAPGVYITQYTIAGWAGTGESTYASKDWQLQYSDDDSNWTTIHSVTNQTAWAQNEVRTFTYKPEWINKKNANDFSLRVPLKVNGNAAIRRAGI